ncbi:NAD(P)/FAD-dependent oxidoreductase [Acetobacter sp.]|uniref:NAD(P)/FAD-dependent oxidoreductase n=1 Tax=Acetobacter sp. TaxID=440 RepID=UPI0025C52F1C|nr:FAD-dependent oxidoreductase [Acetobacter sp.]MCH4089762.1 FAD-binding oxidoreductase [Acetobacter sp.]MCI1298458.1 FAD-binding oxidoreductase [Acetobacter sp.]MCI1316414.1 FAD-binding oxidoreductase [Acetobacter sp.]
MIRTIDAVVIGGGLHGLSCALQLARRGVSVAVLERRWIGRHASTANAGGIRTLNRDRRELDLALHSLELWRGLADSLGEDCGFQQVGQLRIAQNPTELAHEAQRVNSLQQAGYTHEEMLDKASLYTLLPSLAPHCAGASYAQGDGSADPHLTVNAYRRAAESAGVLLLEGHGVNALASEGLEWRVDTDHETFLAASVVIAAGAWSATLAGWAGEKVPACVKASMMTVTERVSEFSGPVIGCVGAALSLKQTRTGSLLIGGGLQGQADVKKERTCVDFHALATGMNTPLRLFPQLAGVRIARCWTGIEARTPDDLPIISPSSQLPGIFYCYGFSGHGFALVPVVGAVIADMIVSETSAHEKWPVNALSIGRFEHRKEDTNERRGQHG